MSQNFLERALAAVLIVVVLAAYTVLAVMKVPVPQFVDVVSGVVIGYGIHTFGVTTGSTATVNGLKSGQLPMLPAPPKG